MYLPIFRGRQYELLGLEEEVQNNLFATSLEREKQIIPIVEPINLTTRLSRTINTFIERHSYIGIIFNPKRELTDITAEEITAFLSSIEGNNDYVLPVIYIDDNCNDTFSTIVNAGYQVERCISICLEPSRISQALEFHNNTEQFLYTLVGESRDFTRMLAGTVDSLVLCNDRFNKLQRNSDYAHNVNEFFSSDHLYFSQDHFTGYSDYSIVGNDFMVGGFAPRAVAIHIIYMNSQSQELYIRHFVSDSNSDITNPAGKFSEALYKLIDWANSEHIDTPALCQFRQLQSEGRYPGLGTIKKLSIQQHLEVVYQYFQSLQG